MKKHLLSLLVLLMTTLSTHAFQSGDLYYSIRTDAATVVAQDYGSENNYKGLTTATIPISVSYNGTSYYVGWIGGGAFCQCTSLTSVNIAYGSRTWVIEENAFKGCTGLTTISFGDAVREIGENAFTDCSSLSSITLPSSISEIENGAFKGCSSLSRTNYAGDIEKWCSIKFYDPYANPISYSKNLYIDDNLVTEIDVPSNVTSIKEYAFYNCQSIKSATIPNSVTSIGYYAFYNVLNIEYNGTATGAPWGARCMNGYVDGYFVYTDETKKHLVACSCAANGDIIIPNSVTTIGDNAFEDCSGLTSITIPNSVTGIGNKAFSGCTSLTSLIIPESVTSIGDQAFSGILNIKYSGIATGSPWGARSVDGYVDGYFVYADDTRTSLVTCNVAATGDITIPESVTNIGNYTFHDCTSLTSITLPNSLSSIGKGAFCNCSSLDSIGIPSSITTIEDSTFCRCSALNSIIIPNSVTSIGNRAFLYCSSLHDVTIGNSVTSIGEWTFGYCPRLTSITIPESVRSLENYTFANCNLKSATILSSYLINGSEKLYINASNIIIGDNITSIGSKAFRNNTRITSITIGIQVRTIAEEAFYGCTSLTAITIPRSVTSIKKDAFKGCSSLTTIIWNAENCNSWSNMSAAAFYDIRSQITSFTIGQTVISIPEWLCYGMSKLTTITSLNCNPPYVRALNAFNIAYKCKLVIPAISIEKYKNSNIWENFSSFEKCLSVNLQSSDSTLGVAQIDQDVDCDSVAIISANPNVGCLFTQWSDGNTDNPRTVLITRDTTFTAEFGLAYSGKCGDDLYWAYSNKEVKITGTGAMYNYTDSTMPWTLLRDSIKTVRVGNNATSIGEYAFANTPKLAELHIGANVEDIGANAFAGCTRLYDIYCYPIEPPFAQNNSFANYNVYVYVPCKNQRDYTLDLVWGEFKFVECIGSEDAVVSGNEVTVSPDYEDATFTWPVTANADSYSLVITKDAETFCTLVFNAQGQLLSIAFKPGRGNAPSAGGDISAPGQAEMTANGFRFKVTGLDEGAAYAYSLTVRNASNTILETYTGDFTTLSSTPTGVLESAGEDACAPGQAEKLLRDGQVVIIRNGKTYDMMGQRL